jgi:2C-methyl-D-erythritol 2,4-cyclodiphosphate synthase
MNIITIKFNNDREIIDLSDDADALPFWLLDAICEHFNYNDINITYDAVERHYSNPNGEEWTEHEYKQTSPDFDALPEALLIEILINLNN